MEPVLLALALVVGAEADDGLELDEDTDALLSDFYPSRTWPPSTSPQRVRRLQQPGHRPVPGTTSNPHRHHHFNDSVLTICPYPSSMYAYVRLYACHLSFDHWRALRLHLKPHFYPLLALLTMKERFSGSLGLSLVAVVAAAAVVINLPLWFDSGWNF
ncbi:hypothetical protein GALMADRAFT_718247 [Galerina marginata CBS 339.88]|uniref:Uncharacterized protein n=1 Tax=Galerina marginata (strain CBS 339.88) TaxID=685588 RepID=A0A067TZU7_GALM3|nr:hypothetical protein GALMADRAFT_718247 [Galerina marginata CBS 339.88]